MIRADEMTDAVAGVTSWPEAVALVGCVWGAAAIIWAFMWGITRLLR